MNKLNNYLNIMYIESLSHAETFIGGCTPDNTCSLLLCVCSTATGDAAALYSEIMMYVLLVCLTFWLLVEMVYCYRKISKSDEQALDTA